MRRRISSVLICVLLAVATVGAARLQPESEAGWRTYVAATERRIATELSARGVFLAMDFTSDAAADRIAVLAGDVVIREVETVDASGASMEVPLALVHHWRGDVFVPHATLDDVLTKVKSGALLSAPEDVLKAAVTDRGPDWIKVYLRLQRRKFVTVVYDTNHDVTFARLTATRATSRSTATRIVEIDAAGSPSERALPTGDDHGYLWKLNAYWRYEQVPGGVIVECESISLSRTVPTLVRYLVGPLVESVARESMEHTLQAARANLSQAVDMKVMKDVNDMKVGRQEMPSIFRLDAMAAGGGRQIDGIVR